MAKNIFDKTLDPEQGGEMEKWESKREEKKSGREQRLNSMPVKNLPSQSSTGYKLC